MNPSSFAIRRPVTVFMLFLALSLLGYLSYRQLPVQLLPNYVAPRVYVIGMYPGASPEMVERELAFAQEADIHTCSL